MNSFIFESTQPTDFPCDINQDSQEPFLLSDSLDALLDRRVEQGERAAFAALDAQTQAKPKPLNNREKRALNALLNSPIMRENLDTVAGCSNGPELIAGLRRRGLAIPCLRVELYDRDGRTCYPGRYELTPQDKPLARAMLGV